MERLLQLADEQKIILERSYLYPPIDAFYFHEPGTRPVITIGTHISDSRLLRVILAHELGHHFTSAGDMIHEHRCYSDVLTTSKAERTAAKWAAEFLMPQSELAAVIGSGLRDKCEIAEHFGVTEELAEYRVRTLLCKHSKEVSTCRATSSGSTKATTR